MHQQHDSQSTHTHTTKADYHQNDHTSVHEFNILQAKPNDPLHHKDDDRSKDNLPCDLVDILS